MTFLPSGGTSAAADGAFGNGTANAVYAVDTTLAAPLIANNVTVNAGIKLICHGYPVIVKGTLTLGAGALVTSNGGSAVLFNAGAAADAGTMAGGNAGGAGAVGAGAAGTGSADCAGKSGGAGGAGSGGAGGAAGVATGCTNSAEMMAHYFPYATLGVVWPTSTPTYLVGGCGGGGGGGNGAAIKGGGGGGGGGINIVIANTVVWGAGAKIQANGGSGADGPFVNCGGGGGGGGGYVSYIYRSETGVRTVEAAGGKQGYSIGGAGVDGNPGVAGLVVVLQV